jgi:hypothetical protein
VAYDDYDSLMQDYRDAIRAARDEALKWWEALLKAEDPDPDTAYKAVRSRWPAGPTSYPRVIDVYRHFHLECEDLNERLENQMSAGQAQGSGWGDDSEDKTRILPPARLLIDSLEPVDPELGEFMEKLVFSPVGSDTNDRIA